MGGDLGEFTYGKRWVLFATFYNVQTLTNTLRDGQAEPYQARWPDLQWGMRPQNPATEPWSLFASVPQLS